MLPCDPSRSFDANINGLLEILPGLDIPRSQQNGRIRPAVNCVFYLQQSCLMLKPDCVRVVSPGNARSC